MFTVVIGVGLLEATPLGVLIALDNLDLVTDDPDFLTHVQAGSHLSLSPKDVESSPVPHAVFVRGEVAGKDQPGPGSLEPEPLALGPHVCLDSFGHRRGHLRWAIVLAQISLYSLASSDPDPSLFATAWGRIPALVGRIASCAS